MIQPGDVIWTPPNTRHWHGAQPSVAMAHYAIAEPLNGVSGAVDGKGHATSNTARRSKPNA